MTHFKQIVLMLLLCTSINAQKKLEVKSPDSKIDLIVNTGENVDWSIQYDGREILAPSRIDLQLFSGESFGKNILSPSAKISEVRQMIETPLYSKDKLLEEYNELEITLRSNVSIIFRVYNQGVAYRWSTSFKNELIIKDETVEFNLSNIKNSFIQYANSKDTIQLNQQFKNSFENTYVEAPLKSWSKTRLAVMPVLLETPQNLSLCILDMNVQDYPGMYLQNFDQNEILKGVFAPSPNKTMQGGHNNLQSLVVSNEDYIAKTSGTRSFPWRAICISEGKDIANNDLAYLLAEKSKLKNISWIKPGKAAWDWWNNNNLTGVSFKAGINTETYKYFIDFAAANQLQYIILDEGFNTLNEADLFKIIPEINLTEICDYATSKNIGVILWAGMFAINKDMDKICKHYADMGVKGFKVDFLDRDDQEMMNFTWRLAEVCAKNKLLLDLHGTFKPNGLQRTYPNVISFEGVFGLESMKWRGEHDDMVRHNVLIPFIRNVAGPMDYTPGSLRNATRENFRSIFNLPMSQGTRCNQMAQYIVFFSPLSMLSDSPTLYKKEQECTDFIKLIPTVWDETCILDGKPGEYIITARRKGDEWYVAGMTNWSSRILNIDLSFAKSDIDKIEFFKDGINADKDATDFKHEIVVKDSNMVTFDMMPGGGFVMKFKTKNRI